MQKAAIAAALALSAAPAAAGPADVLEVEARASGGSYSFDVTVRHADTGWDHYADAWRVVGPDGTVYGTRTLYHPHVGEQPFTRSLSGVTIPEGVTTVTVESHDSVHGWGGASVEVALPR
ncbi:MAG TPA: hypothetical protein VLA52_15085 [Thermohalobaculum sp.]|nr:hypothetical protein [Thermohalobaculum sp.]